MVFGFSRPGERNGSAQRGYRSSGAITVAPIKVAAESWDNPDVAIPAERPSIAANGKN